MMFEYSNDLELLGWLAIPYLCSKLAASSGWLCGVADVLSWPDQLHLELALLLPGCLACFLWLASTSSLLDLILGFFYVTMIAVVSSATAYYCYYCYYCLLVLLLLITVITAYCELQSYLLWTVDMLSTCCRHDESVMINL
jgi:hypothetical protein